MYLCSKAMIKSYRAPFLYCRRAVLGFFSLNMQDLTGKASWWARVWLTDVTSKLGRSHLPAEVQCWFNTATYSETVYPGLGWSRFSMWNHRLEWGRGLDTEMTKTETITTYYVKLNRSTSTQNSRLQFCHSRITHQQLLLEGAVLEQERID